MVIVTGHNDCNFTYFLNMHKKMFAIVPDSNDYKKIHLWLYTLYIKKNPENTYHSKNESCFFLIFFFVDKILRFLKEDRSLFLCLFAWRL